MDTDALAKLSLVNYVIKENGHGTGVPRLLPSKLVQMNLVMRNQGSHIPRCDLCRTVR